ncbi:MAG: hypothetical protein WDA65_06085 [Christensenellales bacterium]
MSKKEKLLHRFLNKPKDFTYDETRTLLSRLNYFEDTKGKTSGSRVRFECSLTGRFIGFDKPHDNIMKRYVMERIIEQLVNNGDLYE